MALRDQPYLPLYTKDFMTDEKLMLCSAKATGVYIRLLCSMHKSEHYGKIKLSNDFKTFEEMLIRFMPYDIKEISEGLEELLKHEVLLKKGGFLIQKRMVNDGKISEKRAIAGSKGGKSSPYTKIVYGNKQNASKNQANSVNANATEYVNKDKGNSKESKRVKTPTFPDVRLYPHFENTQFKQLFYDWLEVRNKQRVPNTQKALTIALNKMHKIPVKTAMAQLEKGIERGWKGFFLPDEVKKGKPERLVS